MMSKGTTQSTEIPKNKNDKPIDLQTLLNITAYYIKKAGKEAGMSEAFSTDNAINYVFRIGYTESHGRTAIQKVYKGKGEKRKFVGYGPALSYFQLEPLNAADKLYQVQRSHHKNVRAIGKYILDKLPGGTNGKYQIQEGETLKEYKARLAPVLESIDWTTPKNIGLSAVITRAWFTTDENPLPTDLKNQGEVYGTQFHEGEYGYRYVEGLSAASEILELTADPDYTPPPPPPPPKKDSKDTTGGENEGGNTFLTDSNGTTIKDTEDTNHEGQPPVGRNGQSLIEASPTIPDQTNIKTENRSNGGSLWNRVTEYVTNQFSELYGG